MVTTTALIVAAGRGTRMGAASPKQYHHLAGKSVLARSIRPFAEHPQIDNVLTVIHSDDAAIYDTATDKLPKLLPPVTGGDTRAQSVLNGLSALRGTPPDRILIHDAARPFISAEVISRVIAALDTEEGAVPRGADGRGGPRARVRPDARDHDAAAPREPAAAGGSLAGAGAQRRPAAQGAAAERHGL